MVPDKRISSADFTDNAWAQMYDVVDDPDFTEKDSDMIYRKLLQDLPAPVFGDFLRRYIYRRTEPDKDFGDLDNDYYKKIITTSFREHGTPASFEPNTTKVSAFAQNCLTGTSVRRDSVLLLGFGLGMGYDEVNGFLTKALKDHRLKNDVPKEKICGYCFSNGYSFEKYRLLTTFLKLPVNGTVPAGITDDDMAFITETRKNSVGATGLPEYERKAYECFDMLYDKARHIAAESVRRLGKNNITADDISEGDMEKVLCYSVPRGTHGNLSRADISTLNKKISASRPTRQRLYCLRNRKASVGKTDIITMNFLIYSSERDMPRLSRYEKFIGETDRMLNECGFSGIYVTDPYECFLLMCILSDDPLSAYTDVWEQSYTPEE